jgi:dienelactone hydrolase
LDTQGANDERIDGPFREHLTRLHTVRKRSRVVFLGISIAAITTPFALASMSSGCNVLPSSSIDAGDLLGAFERDASAPDAANDAGRKVAGHKEKDGGIADAGTAAVATTPITRPPNESSCVTIDGQPDRDVKRTFGRPVCPGAEILEWKDDWGAPRYACVTAPKGIETRAPVPLLIFFHDAGKTPSTVDKDTSLRKYAARFDLTGEAAHAGFVVLAPQGRGIRGNRDGATFDVDYIAEDNVDVMTTDHFVSVLTDRGTVDRRRIYAIGAGNGGLMAATYAMMRADRVAAFATYASDAPRAAWSCAGPPPPAFVLYRACDRITPCGSVERWLRARDGTGAETTAVRLDGASGDEPNCALEKKCTPIVGTANHRRWPKTREDDMLRFFARRTLSVPR